MPGIDREMSFKRGWNNIDDGAISKRGKKSFPELRGSFPGGSVDEMLRILF